VNEFIQVSWRTVFQSREKLHSDIADVTLEFWKKIGVDYGDWHRSKEKIMDMLK
jgi:hypothetical protein